MIKVEIITEAEVGMLIVVIEEQKIVLIIMVRKVIKKMKIKNSGLIYIFISYTNIHLFILFIFITQLNISKYIYNKELKKLYNYIEF